MGNRCADCNVWVTGAWVVGPSAVRGRTQDDDEDEVFGKCPRGIPSFQSTVRLWEGYGRVMGCVIESWHVTRQVLYRVKGKVQLRNHCVPDDHCLQLLCGEQPHFG